MTSQVDPGVPLGDLITVREVIVGSPNPLIVDGSTVDFGTLSLGDPQATKTVRVLNDTAQPLNLDLTKTGSAGIFIVGNVTSLTVPVTGGVEFTLAAGTGSTGTKQATVTMSHQSDPTVQDFSFTVTVQVVP